MNVSSWSIRNPVPAVLVFFLLTVLGLIGFQRLQIQDFPDMDLPTITVTASLEGAAPAQLETQVARKIEDKIATLGGIEHIRTSLGDGTATIRVEFQIDKDVEVVASKRDRYGRLIGKVLVADPSCTARTCPKTLDAGLAQITTGMAWWYRHYAREQSAENAGAYECAEQEARARHAGLWRDADPTAPWDWRRAFRR